MDSEIRTAITDIRAQIDSELFKLRPYAKVRRVCFSVRVVCCLRNMVYVLKDSLQANDVIKILVRSVLGLLL